MPSHVDGVPAAFLYVQKDSQLGASAEYPPASTLPTPPTPSLRPRWVSKAMILALVSTADMIASPAASQDPPFCAQPVVHDALGVPTNHPPIALVFVGVPTNHPPIALVVVDVVVA